jgi:hypothetical protein
MLLVALRRDGDDRAAGSSATAGLSRVCEVK